MDVRKMPEGSRLVAMFPLVASGAPDGYELCVEHTIWPGMDPVYLVARCHDGHEDNPTLWQNIVVRVDSAEAIRTAQARAGWPQALYGGPV